MRPEAGAGRDLADSVLRCPWCRGRLVGTPTRPSCPGCAREILSPGGVPLLIRSPDQIARQIDEARTAGRARWYEDEQSIQFTGSYRHHFRKRREYVSTWLARFRRERNGRLIGVDLGCGDGEHLSWLSGYVDELYASDYNLVRLRRAAVRQEATVILADVTDFPAERNAFDVVFFNHVLEHIPDDVKALREVRRILAPGGIVVLGTPNEGAAFWRLAYRLQPGSRRLTDHVHFYTAESLRDRCRAAGLTVRAVDPIGWGVPHWSIDARIRGVRSLDDAFERIGRRFLPSQATSLYAILTK